MHTKQNYVEQIKSDMCMHTHKSTHNTHTHIHAQTYTNTYVLHTHMKEERISKYVIIVSLKLDLGNLPTEKP